MGQDLLAKMIKGEWENLCKKRDKKKKKYTLYLVFFHIVKFGLEDAFKQLLTVHEGLLVEHVLLAVILLSSKD